MPSRPDIRELASNVKEAFAEMDRETLLEILTFVVKEYVVEGPPPMLVHQAETLADLKNATFAQVISALQTRFDFPELQMFVVDGDQVSVRVGGVVDARRRVAASSCRRPRRRGECRAAASAGSATGPVHRHAAERCTAAAGARLAASAAAAWSVGPRSTLGRGRGSESRPAGFAGDPARRTHDACRLGPAATARAGTGRRQA